LTTCCRVEVRAILHISLDANASIVPDVYGMTTDVNLPLFPFSLLFPDGLCLFRAFLHSEFSEENIAFYLACENYRETKHSKLAEKAKKIYDEFIGSDAPREVNIKQPLSTFYDAL